MSAPTARREPTPVPALPGSPPSADSRSLSGAPPTRWYATCRRDRAAHLLALGYQPLNIARDGLRLHGASCGYWIAFSAQAWHDPASPSPAALEAAKGELAALLRRARERRGRRRSGGA